MPFPIKDYRQIRADILRDIANQQPTAYVGDDSDFAVRANAAGSAVEGLYQYQQWIARQILPDTCDSDWLERHVSMRNIAPRKAANSAAGTVRLSGVVGSPVVIGTEAKSNSGAAFITTAASAIGSGGSVDVAARAALPGVAGNAAVATLLTLTAAPIGVQSQASIVTMTGGTDIETDAALLVRYLINVRMPPAGGAPHDYNKWASEVPGVTDSYVFTQRRAANSVDVVIETLGGVPSVQLIAETLAYIETVRPVGADVLVMAPQRVPVNIAAVLALSGITLADATARINIALQAYFSTLQVGQAVARTKLAAMMVSVPGVVDVNLTVPATNFVPLVDSTHIELAVIGTVALT